MAILTPIRLKVKFGPTNVIKHKCLKTLTSKSMACTASSLHVKIDQGHARPIALNGLEGALITITPLRNRTAMR